MAEIEIQGKQIGELGALGKVTGTEKIPVETDSGNAYMTAAQVKEYSKQDLGGLATKTELAGVQSDVAGLAQTVSQQGEAIGKNTEDIAQVADNTGVDEYPTFSTAEDYKSGDTVNYQGKLYQFTTDHAAGAWTGTDVEETDVVNAHIVQELGVSEDKVVSQKKITSIVNTIEKTVIPSVNILDFSKVTQDKRYQYAINGSSIDSLIDATNYAISEVKPCKAGDVIRFKYGITSSIVLANENKLVTQGLNNNISIEQIGNIYTVTVPEGAYYFRYQFPYIQLNGFDIAQKVAMLTINNDYPDDYISPYPSIPYIDTKVNKIGETLDNIDVAESPNILDLSKVLIDKGLSYSTNHSRVDKIIIDKTDYFVTLPIRCKEGQTIFAKYGVFNDATSQNFSIRFIDEKESYVELGNENVSNENGIYKIIVPANAKYFLYSVFIRDIEDWQNKIMLTIDNDYPSEFTPNKIDLDELKDDIEINQGDIKNIKDDINNINETIGKIKENTLLKVDSYTKQDISEAEIGSEPVYTNSWVHLFQASVEAGIYYVFNVYNGSKKLLVLDGDNIILSVIDTPYGGLVKVIVPENGVKIVWVTTNTVKVGWYLKINNEADGVVLKRGTKKTLSETEIICTNTSIKRTFNKIDGDNTFKATVTSESIITIPVEDGHLRMGLWISTPIGNDNQCAYIKLHLGDGNKVLTYVTNEYMFVSILVNKGQTSIPISFELQSGIDSIDVEISSFVIYDYINKPIFVISFDGTYENMNDDNEGIYDYIFNTLNFPATIHTAEDTYYNFSPLIRSGQVDYSIYGGTIKIDHENNLNENGSSIVSTIEDVMFSINKSTGRVPQSIAPRKNYITPSIKNMIIKHGFKSSREAWGDGCNGMAADVMFTQNSLVSPSGGIANGVFTTMEQLGCYCIFAHRLSDSEEELEGGATNEWTNGLKQDLDKLKTIQDETCVILNMRQFYEICVKENLFI